VSDRHVDYALIGGGLAAGNCARWLRESGADGSILLIGRESDLPYNRPPCSKGYLQGKESREDVLFRPPQWYEEQQIEALTRVSAMKLDLSERVVTLSDRQTVGFDRALLATGANVKRLNVDTDTSLDWGRATCLVPNVKGKPLAAAKSSIVKSRCLVGGVKRVFSAKVKKERVISQKPAPRTYLVEGAKVNLVVSKGKKRR